MGFNSGFKVLIVIMTKMSQKILKCVITAVTIKIFVDASFLQQGHSPIQLVVRLLAIFILAVYFILYSFSVLRETYCSSEQTCPNYDTNLILGVFCSMMFAIWKIVTHVETLLYDPYADTSSNIVLLVSSEHNDIMKQ